jgi:predicted ATPase/DNA-binding SARP family transcriptional activator
VTVALTLLDDVRWRGAPVAGDRARALLAVLAAEGGRPVRAERLIDLVWGDEAPVNAAKTLQVLVSRTRTACGADAIVREATGYRLGVDPAEVDFVQLKTLVRDGAAALDRDAEHAAALATEALELGIGLLTPAQDDDGPLSDIRRAAAHHVAAANVILARANSRTGAHAHAFPALEAAHTQHPDDEALLADLLRSEAAVRGPGAALARFETHRRDLRERLGTNPGERLRRTHRDLLALDQPVRSGVRYDASSLLGRDRDIARLRAMLAESRVVSIVGPGGLGKTRLAHVLARDAGQPVVHVVELVGVTAEEDVVGEIGSVLGVRDSVSARRTLTPEQRADVRARIAQRLGQSPSLLILDNCEHVVGAAAELAAYLVAVAADLRILTTSRAPLAIAAERVYLLGELDAADAAALFCDRARAVRPDARLPDDVVARIVARLDGLPLAIELAAAKARAMAVEEIDRRLEDRFALLRGNDRSAPDRHQTLLAVIDWSWNLLDDAERRALRRLALFNDGFTLDAADAMLGDGGALDAVQGLVDQSLLSIRDAAGGLRYRMLETVREFGRIRLVEAGDVKDARAARRAWATTYASGYGDDLMGTGQFSAIDAIAAEEVNLADELRDAIGEGDNDAAIVLLAALGMFWTVRGEHARLVALTAAVADAVAGWHPPPELEDATRGALAVVLITAMATDDTRSEPIRDLLRQLGPGSGGQHRLDGMIAMLLDYDRSDPAAAHARLERRAADSDRDVALPALQWLSHMRENAGDPVGALVAGERALTLARDEDAPWTAAILRTHVAALAMHVGDHAGAREHALAALPVLQRLGATDDELQLRTLLVLSAVSEGRLADAEAELAQVDALDDREALFGGIAFRQIGTAELALARGDHTAGLRIYRECAIRMGELRLPGIASTGMEPWAVFGEATALTAFAHHAATADDEDHGRALMRACRERALHLLEPGGAQLDFPLAGLALFGLGAWGLLHDATPAEAAVELLVLADRFAYTRMIPTMAWERIALRAEDRAPGRIAALRARHGDRASRELLGAARSVVEQLPG